MSQNSSPADAQQHWKTQQVSKQVHFLLHDLTAAAVARNRNEAVAGLVAKYVGPAGAVTGGPGS